jgi:methylated-DNA-[protein]-cysteine S-methyltransferase
MDTLLAFPTALGWIAVLTTDEAVARLTFGHRSAEAAVNAVIPLYPLPPAAYHPKQRWQKAMLRLLEAYAEGASADLGEIPVQLDATTEFHRTVLRLCREIPWGQTMTYGQLAAKAGAPRAARAVGNCMAANRIPLLIPCHRVVRSGGSLGDYSMPGGGQLKRHLLALEANHFSDLSLAVAAH